MFKEYGAWLVVEIAAWSGAAAMAGKLLADIGCHVARIEGGDATTGRVGLSVLDSEQFELVSRGKQSVLVNWDRPEAAEVIGRLLASAEILVTDAHGLDLVRRVLGTINLSSRFPRLTICACTPFGLRGPMASWVGNEETVQAAGGIMSITGHAKSGPTRIAGAPLTLASAMYAVTSSLADVMRKQADTDGRGGFLDVAVYDAAIAFEVTTLPIFFLTGTPPGGIGNLHSMSIPWNTYPCSDGWVVICCGNHATWVRLCEMIGRPDMPTDPRYLTQDDRIRRVEEVDGIVSAWTQRRRLSEVIELLNANNVAGASIVPLTDVLASEQFSARKLQLSRTGGFQAGGAFHLNNEALNIREGQWQDGAATRSVLVGRVGVHVDLFDRWVENGVVGPVDQKGAENAKSA